MSKTPVIIQMQHGEGSMTCLAMVLATYKKIVKISDIKNRCKLSRNGITQKQLIKVAEDFGLECKTKKLSVEELVDFFVRNNKAPLIVRYRRFDYVVVTKIDNKKVTFNDPRFGKFCVTIDKFKTLYKQTTLLFTPGPNFTPEGKRESIFTLIRPRLKKSRKSFIAIALITAVTIALNVLYIYLSKTAVDQLLGEQNKDLFGLLIGVMAVSFVVSTVLFSWRTILSYKTSKKLALITTHDFFEKILSLPIRFFEQHYNGELLARIRNNQSINETLIRTIVPNLISGLLSIVYAIIMFNYNAMLACIFLGLEIIYVLVILVMQKRIATISRSVTTNSGILESYVLQGLNSIETIKTNACERSYFQNWAQTQDKSLKSRYNYQNLNLNISLVGALFNTISAAILLIFGAFLIIKGNFTFGMLFAFSSLFSKVKDAVSNITKATNSLATMRTNIERVDDLMETPSDIACRNSAHEVNDARKNASLTGAFKISGLNYRYNEEDKFALHDVELSANAGEIIALVGKSGSGKTTLLKILCNLIESDCGIVELETRDNNGQTCFMPKSEISEDAYYKNLAAVEQEVTMFQDSVKNNLTFWDEHIEESDLDSASKTAEIYSRIMTEKEGYDSIILENGRNFSGGELQRLELSRALLQKPKLLILDEFTSALDSLTEMRVFDNIRTLGITCIIAAHRNSTLSLCDKIVMLEDGKVVASGAHDSLYKHNKKYTELVEVK